MSPLRVASAICPFLIAWSRTWGGMCPLCRYWFSSSHVQWMNLGGMNDLNYNANLGAVDESGGDSSYLKYEHKIQIDIKMIHKTGNR